jgi:hypothetical protein
MILNRRRFLESASITMLGTAALPGAFAETVRGLGGNRLSGTNFAGLENASVELFQPLIGESFQVTQWGGVLLDRLTLLAATPFESPQTASRTGKANSAPKIPASIVSSSVPAVNSFGLRFQGSSASQFPQGTYTVTNQSLGSFALFLVPGGPGKSPQTYTAIFSLLVP